MTKSINNKNKFFFYIYKTSNSKKIINYIYPSCYIHYAVSFYPYIRPWVELHNPVQTRLRGTEVFTTVQSIYTSSSSLSLTRESCCCISLSIPNYNRTFFSHEQPNSELHNYNLPKFGSITSTTSFPGPKIVVLSPIAEPQTSEKNRLHGGPFYLILLKLEPLLFF